MRWSLSTALLLAGVLAQAQPRYSELQKKRPDVLRIGGGASVPQLISRVEPDYPAEARTSKVQGSEVLAAVVEKDGTLTNIVVERSLGPEFDREAMKALSRWKFRPSQKNGKPVAVYATIEVMFRLP